MTKPTYIFISEGGEHIFSIEDEITDHDKKSVEAGIMTIIRLADLHELAQGGSWRPIETGVLHPTIPDLAELGPFHTPAEQQKLNREGFPR